MSGELKKQWFVDENNVVLLGYDVVAYREDDRAALGNASTSAEHQGVTFYFSSATNRDKFIAQPETYLPSFGGWCAYAFSEDTPHYTAPDPRTFKFYNGELLVFLNALHDGEHVNTKILWTNNEKQFFEKAKRVWDSLSWE